MTGPSSPVGCMSKDMARFYFHVRDGDVLYLDRQGVECADLKAAWKHALDDARTLFRVVAEPAERWVEVDDGLGSVIATPPEGVACH